MTAKQWLSRARRLENEINQLLKLKVDVRDRLTSITQNYNNDGSQSTKDPHKFDRLAEIESLIDEKVDLLADTRQEIINTISRLDDSRYRQILTGRYIGCWTWEKIALEIHYSYPQTVRLHGFALRAIDHLIKDDKQ